MPDILRAAGAIPVIEDCAQAHGAVLQGRSAGTWGAMGCFSFYPTKNLGALGDGGAIVTGDALLAERVRRLAQYGWTARYRSQFAGGRNSRLDEIQAAVLRILLPRLPGWNERRREIARHYNRLLESPDLGTRFAGNDSACHLYVVRCRNRDALRDALRAASIGSEVHYPVPDYLQDSARGRVWAACDLPETVACCREVLSLPCFPELSDGEVTTVAEAVLAAIAPLPSTRR